MPGKKQRRSSKLQAGRFIDESSESEKENQNSKNAKNASQVAFELKKMFNDLTKEALNSLLSEANAGSKT